MSESRWRRIEPERTDPRRSFSGALRGSAGKGGSAGGRRWRPSAEGGVEESGQDDGVADGVRSAYRVLDEQIRRGQRIAREQAERLVGRGWEDPRQLMEQSMRTTFDAMLDMWMQWVDLTAAAVRFDDWWWRELGMPGPGREPGEPGRSRPAPSTPPAPPTPPTGGVPVTVEVTGDRPTRVWTELSPGVLTTPVVIQPLRSLRPQHPPLMEVTLSHDPGEPASRPLLQVRVPAAQPEGQYHGFVLDAHTGAQLGVVTVEIVTPA